MELGSGEIILILIVALLIYGGRLPEVARALGKSFSELKRGLSETKNVVTKELDVDLHVDLDEDAGPREVQRAAPEHLAKEDITKPHAGETPPAHEPTSTPHDATDATRHEHPN